MLATCEGVLYLCEPVTQAHVAIDPRVVWFHESELYRALVELALSGYPESHHAFEGATDSVRRGLRRKTDMAAWLSDRDRGRRRLIKEVNPLGADHFVRDAQVTCVILVRHPAAVAASYHRMGWIGNADT